MLMLTCTMINITNVTYIFLCISQLKNFISSISNILFWIFTYFGINRYTIKTTESKNLIYKNIRKKYNFICDKYNQNGEPIGISIHLNIIPKFILLHDDYGDFCRIICKQEILDELLRIEYSNKNIELDNEFIPENNSNNDKKSEENKQDNIKYIIKTGDYGCLRYNVRNINILQNPRIKELTFFSYQETLFKNIMNFYKYNNYCKVFINGEPGCGKTFFVYIMAQKLGCYLCDSFDPYLPSSNFNQLYNNINSESHCPIIVLIDEVDILIDNIHNKSTEHHNEYTREIDSKISWNNFMDKIEYGLYPNVILIMNSNKSKREIDKLDSCYLRNGRINLFDKW